METKSLLWCNKTMEDFIGYSLNEMKQMGPNLFQTIMHPKAISNAISIMQFFTEGGYMHTCIYRFKNKKERVWHWFYGIVNVRHLDKNKNVKTLFWSFIKFDTSISLLQAQKGILLVMHEPTAKPNEIKTLSNHQKKLLPYIALGLYDQEIAEIFSNSIKTIETHIKHIRAKLKVHSRLKLVILLKEMGY